VSTFGLNYGLKKVSLSDSSLFFLDIVQQKSIVLDIAGLSIRRKKRLIFQNANTLCTMELIFIKRGVLLA